MELPKQYEIEALLNNSVQPFEAATEEWLEATARDMRKGNPLIDPIKVSSDGILLDGSQRLTAMLRAGRKIVMAHDVWVIMEANASNALDFAIKFNVARRHLSLQQKAELAQQLQRERRWSQKRIADAFGVSRPAVSQWLAAHPDPEGAPTQVEGTDGITRSVPFSPEPDVNVRTSDEDKPLVSAWHPNKGKATKAARAAKKAIKTALLEPTGHLSAIQRAAVEEVLNDLIEAAEDALERFDREDEQGAGEDTDESWEGVNENAE